MIMWDIWVRKRERAVCMKQIERTMSHENRVVQDVDESKSKEYEWWKKSLRVKILYFIVEMFLSNKELILLLKKWFVLMKLVYRMFNFYT